MITRPTSLTIHILLLTFVKYITSVTTHSLLHREQNQNQNQNIITLFMKKMGICLFQKKQSSNLPYFPN